MRAPALAMIWTALGATAAYADAPKPSPASRIAVQILWDQKVPMRDGVKLSATIYRDPKQTKPLPVILTMTPYIAQDAADQGVYFAQHGYVFAAVDLRGRGNSEGSFVPSRSEGKDGYDTVEWLARQPWSDGQVAMWGGSWRGFTQWTIAKEFPPHLKAIAPTSSVYPGVDYPQADGFFYSYMLRWLTYVHGRALNEGLFDANALWANADWERVSSGRAFADLEDITGSKGTVFRTWIAHPREDAFWQAVTPRPEHYARLQLPILTIAGFYDGDQRGALTYYERHMASGPKAVTARHWLILGPWDHAGTRKPRAELGGLSFGPSAVLNMEDLHEAWYDHVLKGGPLPAFLKDRVACFIAGRNTWIYGSELKQIEGPPLKFELDATGAVTGDVTRGGRLVPQSPAAAASVTLISDPKVLPPRDEREAANAAPWMLNQRDVYADSPSRVIWTTAPLTAETVFAGRAQLALQLAIDQPDADVGARLYEVLADGSAVALSDTQVRLRYRRGGVQPVFMTPGKPERVEFPAMQFFARAVAKGSRLRLVVGSVADVGVDRNTNTGGDPATEPLAKARIAKITVMTGPGTGSTLAIPRPDDAVLEPRPH